MYLLSLDLLKNYDALFIIPISGCLLFACSFAFEWSLGTLLGPTFGCLELHVLKSLRAQSCSFCPTVLYTLCRRLYSTFQMRCSSDSHSRSSSMPRGLLRSFLCHLMRVIVLLCLFHLRGIECKLAPHVCSRRCTHRERGCVAVDGPRIP